MCEEKSKIEQVGINHNEAYREGGEVEMRAKTEGRRQKSKAGRQSESDGDGLRARETKPQKSNYRSSGKGVGPAPRHG